MRRLRRVLVGTAVVAAIAVGGAAPASADQGPKILATTLSGAEEFPGPGDPDGFGAAGLVISADRERICYVLAAFRIGTAVAAHIHEAPAGDDGPIVVPLRTPTRGFSAACATVDAALGGAIADTPEQFYVNVHTAAFPAGAIRGQLG
jgi:CHRD domain